MSSSFINSQSNFDSWRRSWGVPHKDKAKQRENYREQFENNEKRRREKRVRFSQNGKPWRSSKNSKIRWGLTGSLYSGWVGCPPFQLSWRHYPCSLRVYTISNSNVPNPIFLPKVKKGKGIWQKINKIMGRGYSHRHTGHCVIWV